jgi:hypothetical protein
VATDPNDGATAVCLALGDLVLAVNQLEYEIARIACGRGSDSKVWACVERALRHPGDAKKACEARIEALPEDLKERVEHLIEKATTLAAERNGRVHGFLMEALREDTGAAQPPAFFHPKSGEYLPADAEVIDGHATQAKNLAAEAKKLSIEVHKALEQSA